jgi:Arc/MetJ family transcription regulator
MPLPIGTEFVDLANELEKVSHQLFKMRMTIELDDALITQALELSDVKTKKDVIHEALRNYVAWMKKNN